MRTYFGHDYFVDGAGEYKTAVIVGVFAYEVDAACRSVYCAMTAKTGFEGCVDFFLEFHLANYSIR